MTPRHAHHTLLPLCRNMLSQISAKERRHNRELTEQGQRLLLAVRRFENAIAKEKIHENDRA